MKREESNTARVWQTPELTTHGAVEEITQQIQKQVKLKELGSSDDFGINGIQDPSGL